MIIYSFQCVNESCTCYNSSVYTEDNGEWFCLHCRQPMEEVEDEADHSEELSRR